VTGTWNGETKGRLGDVAAKIFMTATAAVVLKIAAIHQLDVSGIGKGNLDKFVAIENTQIVVQEVHFHLLCEGNQESLTVVRGFALPYFVVTNWPLIALR
jgi:hypothetical protein